MNGKRLERERQALNDLGRFLIFLAVVLGVWTLMHGYVAWRLWTLPWLASPLAHRLLLCAVALLWASYPLGRYLARGSGTPAAYPLELAGAVWMGALFLAIVALLGADVITGFGLILPRAVVPIRIVALTLAGCLSVVALVQGLCSPVVRSQEIALPGLPRELDGKVLVQLSDLHLGTLLKERWLIRISRQVEALHPDILVITGDLVDGDVDHVKPLVPLLQKLHAPLGVWAVTGNHEFYAGLKRSVALFEECGFKVLRESAETAAPGLVMAGVDDLSAWRQFRMDGDPVAKALAGRPPGATILLCHSPLQAEEASRLGAGLMLSGHTHDGQIWPFGMLVRIWYPYLAGRYTIGPMTLLVCRGTGTWGPPMRLFRAGEILRVTLRSAPPAGSAAQSP
jgi:predicted MPP superfamily phosphohydrolase